MISLGLTFQMTKCTDVKKCIFFILLITIWLVISVWFEFLWILCVLIHKSY